MRVRWIVPVTLSVAVMGAQLLCAQQTPSLIAESGRSIRDSRGGGGKTFRIASSILQETRRINVALPASFSHTPPDRRYPVTIVLDGETNLPTSAAVSEELARHGLIPEAIIVAIENNNPLDGRVRDLTPPGLSVSGSSLNERGDRFLDFIEQELLPAVDRELRGGRRGR